MTKIIAISNHKGGVGKTTSTVNLGAALALKGYKVCLVDLDPQANLTQSFLKDFDQSQSISQLLKKFTKNWYDYEPVTINDNLCIIPSSLDLSLVENELISAIGRESLLKNIFRSFKHDSNFTHPWSKLDVILIDCPPSLGLLTINAFTAADEVLIPLNAEYLPFNGLVTLVEIINNVKTITNSDLSILGVFFTRFDSGKILNRDVFQSVEEFFKDKVFKTTIPSNITLAEAPSFQKDIFSYDNKCKGAQGYMTLCEEILEKYEKEVLDEEKL